MKNTTTQTYLNVAKTALFFAKALSRATKHVVTAAITADHSMRDMRVHLQATYTRLLSGERLRRQIHHALDDYRRQCQPIWSDRAVGRRDILACDAPADDESMRLPIGNLIVYETTPPYNDTMVAYMLHKYDSAYRAHREFVRRFIDSLPPDVRKDVAMLPVPLGQESAD
jgi:hypothetical protein